MSLFEILQGGQRVDRFVSRPRQDNQRFEVPPEVRLDVNALNSGCKMLLMQAVHFGNLKVIKSLLGQENVDLCAKNGYGYTALHIATSDG
ncbi:uncharacterized protein N7503_004280 [Penicillium pulvis]|uniref:uncharacterized protein n=1 Tax=Penicillium pulvis TaxID=1562058 RepID=UPI002549B02D|nr:uncharacterized protein N7503_004280 [Penicillium pulvis]KAJ5806678.1 hypothetical protein N7503_004280 [Penicillium pulvis]